MKMIETHISRVFLHERDVYKVKKPVDFGFLDFRTLEARRRACEAEVTLNRRLAPDIYLGVVPFEGDWAVHMVRLPDADRADQRLADGRLGPQEIDAIARTIAEFHASCRSDSQTARYGTRATIGENVRENFIQGHQTAAEAIGTAEADRLERWQLDFLEEHDALLRRRAIGGRVRDGHGDLRLEHVYIEPGGRLRIIDCIEFNDRFRIGDVCADLAFLSMDLAACGRVDLAELLLARYATHADDFDLYALIDFYESYRAYVRGKIAGFIGNSADARRYFLLALSASRRPLLPPAVIAVGGVIASGKSTVAERVANALCAPVISADRTRKGLAHVAVEQPIRDPAWKGAYDPAVTRTVYGEVMRRADVVLSSGRPVVIDASFRSSDQRNMARQLARMHGVPFRFVECVAPLELCRERLRQRALGASVSDGRLEIFDAFCARYQPPDELPAGERIRIDTSLPIAQNLPPLTEQLEAARGAAP